MKRRYRTGAICLVGLACLTLGSPSSARSQAPDDRSHRLLEVQKVMLTQLDKLQARLQKSPDGVTTRDLANASLLVLRTKGSSAVAESLLRRMYSAQDMDESKPDYGTFPWSLNDPSMKDGNAIEFATQALGAVYLGYGDRLSKDFKKESEPHLRAALVALAAHHVKVSYTNIVLMNTMDTIELAQYLGDDQSLRRGTAQWQQWWDYTADNGVHEFDSPTYYAVDLGDLVLGYLYVKDAATHNQIGSALDMFWRDIASNYLLADDHLAGAHSRDYYFLTGRGGIEFYLYMEGLYAPEKREFQDIFLEKVDLLESERPGGYRVPKDILALSTLPQRVVRQRWDVDPEAQRYTYLTQNFAMGYATGKAGDQDKMFAADLAGDSPEDPPDSITLVPDVVDAPYGVEKKRDRSGHLKPVHLALNLSAVQDKGVALLVADLDPNDAVDNPTFATNLILPSSAASIVIDKDKAKISSRLDIPFNTKSVLGVRTAKACFVARVISVDRFLGVDPTVELKADDQGLKEGALRLAIYHARTSFANTDQRHLHVALLVEAADCSTDAELSEDMEAIRQAKVRSRESSDGWEGTAQVGQLTLQLAEDPLTRRPAHSEVNGKSVASPVFTLNGIDLKLGLKPN